MSREETLYLLPYIFSLILSLGIFIYSWFHRQVHGATIYSWSIGGQTLTILGFILELISPNLESKIIWDKFQWLTGVVFLVTYLIFAIEFTSYKLRRPRFTWILFSIVPLAFSVLVLTDGWQHLIYPNSHLIYIDPQLNTVLLFPELQYDFTYIVKIYAVYIYLASFYGIGLLIKRAVEQYGIFRLQFLTIALGFFIPVVFSILSFADISITPQRDNTPFTFALGNLIVAIGLFRYRLFDIAPFAREQVIENMTDPVIVLDSKNRVVDINQAASLFIGKKTAEVFGLDSEAALSKWPFVAQMLKDPHEQRKEISTTSKGETFFFDIRISPISNQRHIQLGRIIVARDVTRLKNLEMNYRALSEELEQRVHERTEELREGAERYRTVIENQTEFIVRWKPDRTRTFVNEAYCRYFGMTTEEAMETDFISLIAEDDRQSVLDKITRLTSGVTQSETEVHRVPRLDGSVGWQEWTDHAIRDDTGKVVEFQSIGRDITERKRAEEALRESERILYTLMGNLPGMVYRCLNDKDWTMEYVSEGCRELTGYSSNELKYSERISYGELVHPDDRDMVWETVQRAIDLREPFQLEYRIFPLSGNEKYVWERGRGVFDDQGNIQALEGFIMDITERKHADKAIRESEGIYRKAIEVAGGVPYRQTYHYYEGYHLHIVYDFMGEGIRQITGYGPEEITEEVWDSLVQESILVGELSKYSWSEAIQRVRKGSTPVWQCEHRILTRQGESRWIYEVAVEMRDKDGMSYGSIGLLQDITERIRSEEEIRKLSRAVEQSNVSIVITDTSGKIEYVNPYFSEVTGYSLEEVVGQNPRILQSGVTNKEMYDELWATIMGGKEWRGEFCNRKKNGELYWETSIISPIVDSHGKTTHFVSVKTDITERKRAEEILLRQLAYDELMKKLLTRFATCSYEEVDSAINLALVEIAGFFGGEYIGFLLLSKDKKSWDSAYHWHSISLSNRDYPTQSIPAGTLSWTENKIVNGEAIRISSLDDYPPEAVLEREFGESEGTKSLLSVPIKGKEQTVGGVIDIASYTHPIAWTDTDEKHLQLIGDAISNLLERKRAEVALQKSEKKHRLLFESANDSIIIMQDDRCIDCNSRALEMFGCQRDDIIGKTPVDFSPEFQPDGIKSVDKMTEKISAVLQGEPQFFEWKHCWLDKTLFDAEVSLSLLELEDGIFIQAIVRDVTSRRQAEEALRKSEERFSKAFRASPTIIAITQLRDGKIIEVNEAFETIIGYSRAEAIGKTTMDLKIWGSLADRDEVMRILRTDGQLKNKELQFRTQNGQYITCNYSAELIELEGEKCLLSTIEDITVRKQAEEALQQSEERFSKAFRASPIIVMISQISNAKILEVNDTFETISGFNREEAIGKSTFDLNFWVNPEDRSELLSTLLAQGEVRSKELNFRIKNGSVLTCLVSIDLIELGGEQCALATIEDISERKQSENRILRLNRLYVTISQINQTIIHSRSKDDLFRDICRVATDHGQFHMAWIGLLDKTDGFIKPAVFSGHELGYLENLAVNYQDSILGGGPTGRAIREGRCVICDDIANDPSMIPWQEKALARGYRSTAAVPLREHGEVIGALSVYADEPHGFDTEDEELLEQIGMDVSFALDSIDAEAKRDQAEENLAEAYDTTLEGWAKALELRDKETEGHSRRVTETTLTVARAMGFSEAELVHIRRGSILHDIGKMGIPDDILRKNGPLTEKDREIVFKHPITAYELLKPIAYLEPALDIPYSHHEKWDGSGYPRALKGEEIPLSARIFAVVDVWDALSSDRPYRNAWPRKKVTEYLGGESGKHFDPKVVGVFLKMLEKGEI